MKTVTRFASLVLCTLMISAAAAQAANRDKMNPADIIAKHLAAIGTDKDRQAVKSQLAVGTVNASTRSGNTGVGRIDGRVVMASQGARNLIGMVFDSPDYPSEKFGYDGKKLTIGFVRPGVRSRFGQFIISNESIFKQGLIGGALSSSWTLLDPSAEKAKLEYAGTEKINNRETHKIRYQPRRGSDMRITLYFDTENFRHVRSLYEREVAAGQGANPNDSSRLRDTRYRLTEDFSDFKKESGLTLPHTYKMQMLIDVQSGTLVYDWQLNLNQFNFNTEFDANAFDVTAT